MTTKKKTTKKTAKKKKTETEPSVKQLETTAKAGLISLRARLGELETYINGPDMEDHESVYSFVDASDNFRVIILNLCGARNRALAIAQTSLIAKLAKAKEEIASLQAEITTAEVWLRD